ncbi:hypothetical protein BN1723_017650 [Verticillium longisporum]|uniref:Uncharacterized protein n=1 Tax=Verticillium longisporum TaxID=100787 RepID=A0A0G4L8T9_VERLO|nr:hypothetical protein HYQ44_011140 [Verticillium longisporum]CRK18437.1 hypothetical protein BN1723_017650 [Verticillium longisporum]
MSSSVTATKVTTTRGSSDAAAVDKMTLYKLIMTPIIFVSFLVSLAWVDLRYTLMRSHGRRSDSRLPAWLHHLVYRPAHEHDRTRPARAAGGGGGQSQTTGGYYHTKQKKLAKMEMADAFEIRTHVAAVLAVLVTVVAWTGVSLLRWVWTSVAV